MTITFRGGYSRLQKYVSRVDPRGRTHARNGASRRPRSRASFHLAGTGKEWFPQTAMAVNGNNLKGAHLRWAIQ